MKRLILLLVVAFVVAPAYPQSHLYVFGALSIFDTDHSHHQGLDLDSHLVGSGSGHQIGFGLQANGVLGIELIYDRAPRITEEEFHRVFGTSGFGVDSKRSDYLSLVLTGSYRPPWLQELRLVAKGGYSHYWQKYYTLHSHIDRVRGYKLRMAVGLLRGSVGVAWPMRKTNLEIELFLNSVATRNVQTSWVSAGLRYRF